MDKKLQTFFNSLTKEQQRELISWMGRINLATDINKDPEFLEEALEPLFEKYPIIKNGMQGLL